MQNVDAEVVETHCNLWIEPRSSRHQIAHFPAKGFVDLAEQNLSGVHADFPQAAIKRQQDLEQSLR